METACTRTRTWSSFGTGRATSLTSSTSGDPYRSRIRAFIVALALLPPEALQGKHGEQRGEPEQDDRGHERRLQRQPAPRHRIETVDGPPRRDDDGDPLKPGRKDERRH